MKPSTIALVLVLTASSARADPDPPHRLSIEQDPLAYLMHGWDVIAAYQHPALPHARITLSVYAADWPATPNGFTNALTGVTTKLQYFFRGDGRGWMIGTQLAFVNEVFTSATAPGRATIDAFNVGAIAGYRWMPFGRGFFIYPWGRLGVSLPVHGSRDIMLGDRRMTASWFDPVLTFHIGYELTFH